MVVIVFLFVKILKLANGKADSGTTFAILETLFVQELEPAFNVNVGSEKLMLC